MKSEEQLITAWIRLTGALKNTRMTKGMAYNEAVVMLLAYRKYCEDGIGLVPFKEVVAETGMFKSLVNRTIETLVEKGYLVRSGGEDKRTTFIRPVPEKLGAFLEVHERTLALVRRMVALIGQDDAEAFVRIGNAVWQAAPLAKRGGEDEDDDPPADCDAP